jgi:hypothetical protein
MFTSLFSRSSGPSIVATVPTASEGPQRWSIEEVPNLFAVEVSRRAETVSKELDRLTSKLADLLPVEAELAARFEFEIACLKADQVALERQLDAKFKRIDMGFMRLNKGKFPAFAMFDIAQPAECAVSIDRVHRTSTHRYAAHWTTSCEDPHNLMWTYANLQPLKDEALAEEQDVTIWTDFSGVIPDEVRHLINHNQDQFDQMVLVAEVTQWQKSIAAGDPIVIGRVGPLWWLIAKFDTTPFEEYVSKEFTTEL